MKNTTIVLTVAATTLLGASPGSFAAGGVSGTASTPPSAARLATLNRAEVRALLAKIEQAERPEPQRGAMCYKMALPPNRAEYVCPTGGERTLHGETSAAVVEREVPACRRLFRALPQRGTMQLDESSFCRKRRPEATAAALVLTIRFDDGTTNVVRRVTSADLRLLAGALAGKLVGETITEGEEPLKDNLPRLRELLGEKAAQ